MTFTQHDIDKQRDTIATMERDHTAKQAAAETWLANVKDAVETDGADRPSPEQVTEQFADADKLAKGIDAERAILSRMHQAVNGRDPADQRPPTDQVYGQLLSSRAPTLASRFLAHPRVQEAMASGGRSAVMRQLSDIEMLTAEEFAASLSVNAAVPEPVAAVFDGAPLVPDDQSRVGTPRGLPVRQPTLLDWVRVGTTESDSVPYVRQTVETPNIVGVTGDGVDTAGEATVTYVGASEEVVDRVNILLVPERNLEDAGRLRSTLDGRLAGMHRRDLENQLINGDGTAGDEMTGIINWASIGGYTRGASEALSDALHKGITDVRTNLLEEPDGIALGAADLESLVLARDGTDNHYTNTTGPFGTYPMMIWQKRATVAHVLPAVTAIVGKWDEDELVIRQGATIEEFRQDSDNVRKRLVTIRGYYRATNIIERAQAFTVVDTTVS